MYIQLPPVLIVYVIGKIAVADYGVALQVLQVSLFISVGISIVLQPVLARKFEEDTKIWKSNVFQYINIVVLISLIGAAAMYYIAPYLVNIVFGERYSEAANIVKYFSIVFFLQNITTGLIQPVLVSGKKINIYYAVYSVCLLLNIAGCLVLLPKYSIVGSAYSLIVSELFAMIIFVSYIRSMFRKIEVN
jgi:O-antigen/teichoic acid export membrane protein